MSPNAIQNTKDQQIKQAEQLRDHMKGSMDRANQQVNLLGLAESEIDSMGTIPSFGDVKKVANALKYMFESQLIAAQATADDAKKNYDEIVSALKVAQSPIHTASRIIP